MTALLPYTELLAATRRHADEIDFGTPQWPLLVTGCTGVAGYNALIYLQSQFPDHVFGVVAPNAALEELPNMLRCKMTRYSDLDSLFEEYRFASVLDCAGNCALKSCQLNPQMAWELNVEVSRNVAICCRKYSARLVHLSVDMVFGGRPHGDYLDTEPPTPVNVYGRTMATAEQIIAAENPYAAMLRISMPMGLSPGGHAGAIDWIASRFLTGRAATLYYDEVRTPTFTDCLARVARSFLANDFSGLLNAGGPQCVSLYQMAQIINRVGGFDPELLYGLPKDEACPIPPRVSNCSMNSEKIAAILGRKPFLPWPLEPELFPTDIDWHKKRDAQERGSRDRMIRLLASPFRE